MKKHIGIAIVLGLSLVLAAGSAFWYWPELLEPSPKPAVDVAREIDFGNRDLQTTVEAQVPIRNKGRAPLLIDGITTDCGCLAVLAVNDGGSEKINTLEIPAYGEATLRLSLGVGGPPGVQDRRLVTFTTNDPRNPRVDITLRVTPVARYAVAPTLLLLGTVPVGAQVKRELEILVAERDLPAIHKVTCSNSHFRVSFEEVEFPLESKPQTTIFEPRTRLTVCFDTPPVPGEVTGTISAYCEGRDQAVVLIPVSARVVPLVELSPQELTLPRTSTTGAVYSALCVCRAASMKPFKMAIKDLPDDVVLEIKDVPGNPSEKILEIDAVRLRSRIPAEGLVIPVKLTAEVGNQSFPLTLKLTVQRE